MPLDEEQVETITIPKKEYEALRVIASQAALFFHDRQEQREREEWIHKALQRASELHREHVGWKRRQELKGNSSVWFSPEDDVIIRPMGEWKVKGQT